MEYQNDNTEIIDVFENISQINKELTKKELVLKKYNKQTNKLLLKSILFIPLFVLLYIISLNSNNLVNKRVSYLLLVLITIFSITLILGIIKEFKIKRSLKKYAINFSLLAIYLLLFILPIYFLYGPNPKLRNYIIEKSISTKNYQYLATWFYDSNTINNTKNNIKDLTIVDTNGYNKFYYNTDNNSQIIYANKYEEEILSNNFKKYHKININNSTIKGNIYVVYNEKNVIFKSSQELLKEEKYNELIIGKRKDNIILIMVLNEKEVYEMGEITNILSSYNVTNIEILKYNKIQFLTESITIE